MIIDFKTFLVITVPFWVIFRIIKIKQRQIIGVRNYIKYELVVNLLFIYLLYLAEMTVFPLSIAIPIERRISLIPFKTIMQFIPILLKHGLITNSLSPHLNAGAINIIGNIVVFIPVGVLIPMLDKGFAKFKTTFMIGFTTSFSIEILQFLFTDGRCMDVDDLILNTLGVAIGWVIFITIRFLIRRYKESITK
jgi:glycopeptide antibiotics resistance protein